MTDTTDSTEAAAPSPSRGARRWKLLAGLAAAAGVLAVATVAFAVTRDDDDQSQSARTQIAAAHRACQQWLDGDGATEGTRPPGGWCDDMAGWMNDNSANGQMMMGGRMMWDTPQAMRAICTRATGNDPNANDDAADWCDQMVGWMSEHMGDWDNWHDYWGS